MTDDRIKGVWLAPHPIYYTKKGEANVKNEFKVGDLVFEIVPNRKIRLVSLTSNNAKLYPVRSDDYSYTNEGHIFYDEAGTPSLFHATTENRQALVTLYGEDAVPKLPPRGSELTKAMLKEQDYVLCWVSDFSDSAARENKELVVIDYMDANEIYFVCIGSHAYGYAVPVDMNGNEIEEIEEC